MRTRCVALALGSLLIFACSSSSTNDSPGGGGGTSGSGGAAGTTGGADAGEKKCEPLAPFENVDEIPELNSGTPGYGDLDARFSPDETIVYFSSNRTGIIELFTAKRSGLGGQFSAPVQIDKISVVAALFAPTVTGDLLDIYFAANLFAEERIFQATRLKEVNAFDSGAEVPGLSVPEFSTRSPYVLPAGNVMYMVSNRSGPSSQIAYFDIYRAEKSGVDWKTPELVANINNDGVPESVPVVMPDESALYFGRPSNPNDLDILVTLHSGNQFGTQQPIEGPVNTPTASEQPSFISSDGCRLYFFRTIDQISRIYVATRTPQ